MAHARRGAAGRALRAAVGAHAASTGATPAVRVVACASPEFIASLDPHLGLDTFRPPASQHEALVGIAGEDRGCVTVAIQPDERRLVGYVAFHAPSEVETWGDDASGAIVELGAVEVADVMRGQRLAERMLTASFADGRFDDTVVFATLYRWHYDLGRTGLGALGYRRMLERLYGTVGLVPASTTDPEIAHDPANRLVARVGPHAPPAVVAEFDRLRNRLWGTTTRRT